VVGLEYVGWGINSLCTSIAGRLYESILNAPVIEVNNMRTAEMTKLLENVYQYVNVSFVNELALLSEKIDINFFEVVRAASTIWVSSFHAWARRVVIVFQKTPCTS
jgi:UDP-N-acetyl-D-mannosaminuronate dehydrogenase